MDLNEFNRLKKQVEAARRKADQAAGALSQLQTRLKEEFGCASVEDAVVLLRNKQTEVQKAEKLAGQKLAEFKEKYGEILPE